MLLGLLHLQDKIPIFLQASILDDQAPHVFIFKFPQAILGESHFALSSLQFKLQS